MDDKLVRLSDVLESANRHRMYAAANRESVNSFAGFVKEIASIPAVDGVEVVRCRECRYFSITKDNDLHLKVSGCYRLKKLGEEYPLVVQGDGYCSWGQRREEVDA